MCSTPRIALTNCGQIFRYAIATGRAERDPAADLRGALPPVNGGHFASITDPAGIGALLRAIDGYEGTLVARSALRTIHVRILNEVGSAEPGQIPLRCQAAQALRRFLPTALGYATSYVSP